MIYSLSIQGKKKMISFLASNFLMFMSNIFVMLNIIFYEQLKSGDSAESCLWLWVNFHLNGCLVLVA